MPSTVETLAKVCGEDAVRPAAETDAVAGVPAGTVCRPAGTEEVADVLRACSDNGWRVVVRGSGSKVHWGGPPAAVDVVLDTTRLDQVLEHAAGDLVVRAQAGTPFVALQQRLAGARQQLALDSPYPDATLGGIVATATSGPRRLLHGTARDLLIGVTAVLADGTVARSGGKVVKNVAGYDLGKLYTGSYGSLGVITEVTFRLHPVPEVSAYVGGSFERSEEVQQAVLRLRGAQLVPSAVEVERVDDGFTLTVLLEGIGPGVAARVAPCLGLIGGEELARAPVGWGELPAAATAEAAAADGVLLKVVAEPAAVAATLDAVHGALSGVDPHYRLRGSAGVNVVHVAVSPTADADAVAEAVRRLRLDLREYDGSVVVLSAPAEVRGRLDLWGPVAGMALMRRIKEQFDPGRLLAPGRFVGGI